MIRVLKKYYWLFGLLLIFLPFRYYHISYPILDAFNFRQTQTATFTLNMYKNGIDLFRTELDIFGIGRQRYLTLEFPIYEAIVATVYRVFGASDIWGRVVSISAGFIGAWYLYQLVVLLSHKKNFAFLSAFFFLAAPINMFYQRTIMIDPTIVAFLLAGTYYACHWIEKNDRKSYVLSIVFLSLGFIQKALYGPFWLIPIVWYYLKRPHPNPLLQGEGMKSVRSFILLILIPLLALYFWVQHTNALNTANGQLFFTSYDAGHIAWNFGTFADRLSMSLWHFRIKQVFNGIMLKPGLIFFLSGLIFLQTYRMSGFFYYFLISQLLYFLILFRVQTQNYYQLVMTPAFAPFLAGGVVGLSGFMKGSINKKVFRWIFVSSLCAFYLSRSWISIQPSYFIDWNWYSRIVTVGKLLDNHTHGMLAAAGNEWNSAYTYYSGKKMKHVGIEEIDPQLLEGRKEEGYSFLLLIETEKYPSYLKQVKPSHSLDFLQNMKNVYDSSGMQLYLF